MKRPTTVWIICIYIAFTQLSALISIAAIFIAPSGETEWAANWYLSQPWWALVYLIINASAWIAAAIYLFLMRKLAFTLFLIAAVFGLGNLLWQSLSPWLAASPASSIQGPVLTVGLIVGLIILLAIVGYVWSLAKRDLLR